jgi:hypothetical protein
MVEGAVSRGVAQATPDTPAPAPVGTSSTDALLGAPVVAEAARVSVVSPRAVAAAVEPRVQARLRVAAV